jgi:hypothetical protein
VYQLQGLSHSIVTAPFCSTSVLALDNEIAWVNRMWLPLTYWGCDAMYLICILTQNKTQFLCHFSSCFCFTMSLCAKKSMQMCGGVGPVIVNLSMFQRMLPVEYESVWAPYLVWILWWRAKLL